MLPESIPLPEVWHLLDGGFEGLGVGQELGACKSSIHPNCLIILISRLNEVSGDPGASDWNWIWWC